MLRNELLNRITFVFVNHPRPNGYYGDVVGEASDLWPDSYEVSDEQLSKIDSIVGWYQPGSYEGDGFVIVKTIDDKYSTEGLSHCSCYGPWDGFTTPTQTWEEMLEQAKRNPAWMEEEKDTWAMAAKLFGKSL